MRFNVPLKLTLTFGAIVAIVAVANWKTITGINAIQQTTESECG